MMMTNIFGVVMTRSNDRGESPFYLVDVDGDHTEWSPRLQDARFFTRAKADQVIQEISQNSLNLCRVKQLIF